MDASNPTLAQFGWKPFFSEQVSVAENRRYEAVRVMSVHRGMVTVSGEAIDDSVSSRLAEPKGPEDRPTVGDWLLLDRDDRSVVRILER
jgi:ribosome biogenesis GTPase